MELSTDKILGFLPDSHPWASTIICVGTIASTNTHAKNLAADGAPHGTVLIANHQTGGRGRMGRSFHSPAGSGIYLSVILRPDHLPGELMHLTCAAAVAMCDAVERCCGLRPGIKWTNDLVVGKRKLGGILTELSIDPKTGLVDYAIVGIGINCCHGSYDFPRELEAIATAHLAMPTRPQTVSMRLLLRHAEYITGFALCMAEKAKGDQDKAFELFEEFRKSFGKYEFEIERYFDHGLAFTSNRLDIKRPAKVMVMGQ